jgi:hypothetical protein
MSAEPTLAILDFDGDDLTAAEMAEGGWSDEASVPSFISFVQLHPALSRHECRWDG